jgi:hypothetical protein
VGNDRNRLWAESGRTYRELDVFGDDPREPEAYHVKTLGVLEHAHVEDGAVYAQGTEGAAELPMERDGLGFADDGGSSAPAGEIVNRGADRADLRSSRATEPRDAYGAEIEDEPSDADMTLGAIGQLMHRQVHGGGSHRGNGGGRARKPKTIHAYAPRVDDTTGESVEDIVRVRIPGLTPGEWRHWRDRVDDAERAVVELAKRIELDRHFRAAKTAEKRCRSRFAGELAVYVPTACAQIVGTYPGAARRELADRARANDEDRKRIEDIDRNAEQGATDP